VAGAFAVVGVADVVFRTGREIYKFLDEIADAPKELVVLREVMTEFLQLDKHLQKCLRDLKNRTSTVISSDAVPPL
jgi:predicted Zn-dependent protease